MALLKIKRLVKNEDVKYHIDHIFPLSKAPGCKIHHEDNLQIVKENINLLKSDSLTYTHPDIKHWTELPDHILSEIEPEILEKAWKEWNDYNSSLR